MAADWASVHADIKGVHPEEAPQPKVDENGKGKFLSTFANSKGAPQIIFLCMILALSLGSTVSVIPGIMQDRFARLNYGFSGEQDCAALTASGAHAPQECTDGANDAQNAQALSQFVLNILTFVTSSVVGSMSDVHGRRSILLVGIFLTVLPPLCLVLMQLLPSMSPYWYYIAAAAGGIVNFLAIAISVLSDVMPKAFRAPCFGLLLAGFSLGFAFSPMIALTMSQFHVSLFSCLSLFAGSLFALVKMPETLPAEARLAAASRQENSASGIKSFILRPVFELSILNRDTLFRTLALLAFFSGLAASADQSLLIYYVEQNMHFQKEDVGKLFMILGLTGIFVQSVILKVLTDLVGERAVIVLSFAVGTIHNVLIAIATSKDMIFGAVALGTLTMVSFPTISAIKSNNVKESEQGRIQGALYSVKALSGALGPAFMRCLYLPGWPGFMFMGAAFLYSIATVCGLLLPKGRTNSKAMIRGNTCKLLETEPGKDAMDKTPELMGA
jgi:DHA1 family tetracycline resistance protein-like MFS transporter